MAFRPQVKGWRWAAGLVVGLACTLSSGCVSLGWFSPKSDRPTAGPVHQIHTTWENRLITTEDIVNGGRPLQGLAGRLYLFGPETGHPLKGNGEIIVDLYDKTQVVGGGKVEPLEQWRIDKETLHKLAKKDIIGWGYTLFLPWPAYHADIRQVSLHVKFVPDQGHPLFSPPATIILGASDSRPVVEVRQVPASSLPTPQLPPASPRIGQRLKL